MPAEREDTGDSERRIGIDPAQISILNSIAARQVC